MNSLYLQTDWLLTGFVKIQLGFYSGTLFVTFMSVDRYLAIVHAIAAMRARTTRCGIIASITVIASITHLSLRQPLRWMMLRNFSENTVGLFVCLPIMIFCYVNILVVLSKSRNSKKDKAVKLIFTIVSVFVVCWVPYNVTVFLQTLQMFGILSICHTSKIHSATGFAEIIALSHCCLNPVIYAFVGEKVRKSLRNALSRCLCCCRQSRGTTVKDTSNTPVNSDY